MKLKFKHQSYQLEATSAIASVFLGQGKGHGKERVAGATAADGTLTLSYLNEIFSNKKIEVLDSQLLKNIQAVQQEAGLPVSKQLDGVLAVKDGAAVRTVPQLTIEMETGTGKTYVYTKAMFELNKQYGWNKFIIMVPSVAIREGVYKSLDITADHFQAEYGKKLRYFIYDTKNKSNLTNIKNFAQTANIEVMVMNYQAFGRKGKDALKIFQKLDELQSEKPIDIIKRARPILIIDEPQRFGTTANSLLSEFNPLFITRYSATHKAGELYNQIYRLDAIDAYQQKLVKKIKVKGIEVRGLAGGHSYLFLDQIHVSAKTYPSATVQMELEAKQGAGIKKVHKRIKEGDNLFEISGNMSQYQGYTVAEINALYSHVRFTNGVEIRVGQVLGDVDESHLRRLQIRETIKSHLEKERELFARGIKVLSLFFIDEVKKYRAYNEKGEKVRSEYEEIFEEEYQSAIAQTELFDPEYQKYLDEHTANRVHQGYFSVDKKGLAINSNESRNQEGSDDVSAYDLIMKNKERLLSFSEPTRFIFSHSALREGWDNPNIFQICTLRHTESTISKRQEIGRGLRIAVNQAGDRMDVSILGDDFFATNTLTVVANEAYDDFARGLQNEILDSLKNRPAKLTTDVFKDRVLKSATGESKTLTDMQIARLLVGLEQQGFLDAEAHVTDACLVAIETGKLALPDELIPYTVAIAEVISKVHATRAYKAAGNAFTDNVSETNVKPNDNFAKQEFQELWSKIRVKTVYEVTFDSAELVRLAVGAIDAQLQVREVTARIVTGVTEESMTIDTLQTGTAFKKTESQIVKTESILGRIKYDLLSEVARATNLTRQSVAEILRSIAATKFALFKQNPEDFMAGVVRIINEQKAATLIDKIEYKKTAETYDDEIFTINHLRGSLQENILAVQKHIYDYVKTDSKVERAFATDLDLEGSKVVVYAKLPRGFRIPTPVGDYSPDWALVFDEKEIKHIYFVAETKGSMQSLQLKAIELQKINYAKKHFASLTAGVVQYDVVDSYQSLMEKVMK